MCCANAAGIYDELDAQLEALGLTCECLGGGKIEHNPHEKTITIFGTSQVFYAFVLCVVFSVVQPGSEVGVGTEGPGDRTPPARSGGVAPVVVWGQSP